MVLFFFFVSDLEYEIFKNGRNLRNSSFLEKPIILGYLISVSFLCHFCYVFVTFLLRVWTSPCPLWRGI